MYKLDGNSMTAMNYLSPVLNIHILFGFTDTWIEEPSSGLRPSKTNSEMKYLSRSLRLNNNNITDLCDLQKTVCHFLAEPSQLAWLDLSFNNISHIDQVSFLSPWLVCLAVFLLSVLIDLQHVCACVPGFE